MLAKIQGRISIFAAFAVALVLALAMAGCQGSNSNGVAAKVNGVEIKEKQITDQIEALRKNNDLETEKKWAEYLNSSNMTPSSFRDQLLDSLIEQEIVKQYANEKECAATDDEINAQVDEMKGNYSDDNAWNDALSSAGFENEDAYRDILKYSIAYQKLQDKFTEEAELSDESLLEQLPDKLTSLDGAKKSSHILFAEADEAKANEILAQIKSGSLDFAQAAKDNSTDTSSAEDGGNVGWDKQTSFVTEYQEALDNLSNGQVSDLVKSTYGYHIIKCTGVFNKPENVTSLSQVPSDMLDKIREDIKSSESSTALQNWTNEKKESANIERNDMPSDASYNVDVEKYKTDEQKQQSENSDGNSESSDNSGDEASTSEGDGQSENADENEGATTNESTDKNQSAENADNSQNATGETTYTETEENKSNEQEQAQN